MCSTCASINHSVELRTVKWKLFTYTQISLIRFEIRGSIVHTSWLSIQTKHFLTQFLLLLFKLQLHPLMMALQCPGSGMAIAPVYLHVLGTLGLSTSLWEVIRNLTYQNQQPGSPWEASSAQWGVQSLSEALMWMEQWQSKNAQLQVRLRYDQNTIYYSHTLC